MQSKTWGYEELTTAFSPQSELGSVIEQLTAEVSRAGGIVCEVEIDGRPCFDDSAILSETLTGVPFAGLTVKYSTLEKLCEGALVSIAEHIQNILEFAPAIAGHLRGPEPGVALQGFSELMTHCQQTTEMVSELKQAFSRLPGGPGRISLWNSAEQQVSAVLKALLDTFEVRDLILTADLLEYELASALEAWREVLEQEVQPDSSSTEETGPANSPAQR